MTARDLALASFWTERPLVRLYIERTGRHTFSLRELIAFAEHLPASIINRLQGETNGNAARNPNPYRQRGMGHR